MYTYPTGEYVFSDERVAKEARRTVINAGWPVSLIAYDPDRDAYVFDVLAA